MYLLKNDKDNQMRKSHCFLHVNFVRCEKKIFYIWGKRKSNNDDSDSYHPLVYHCLDVAAVGETILDSNPKLLLQLNEMTNIPLSSLRPLLRFFLAVHDLGKVSEQFQNLYPELYAQLTGKQSHQQYLTHHTILGKKLWDDAWNSLWASEMLPFDREEADGYDWQVILEPWSLASMGHHGRPPMPEVYSKPNHDDSDKASALLFAFANLFFPSGSVDGIIHYNDSMERGVLHSSWLLAGIMVLSDWIASNEHYFSFIEKEMSLDEYWNTVAVPAAASAVATLGFIAPRARMGQKIGELFPFITDSTPLNSA
jgi:CRISPR-associated endonuclease/helicase Cas3